MKRGFALILCTVGLMLQVQAQSSYVAKITVKSGNSYVVKALNIKGDRIYSDNAQVSTLVEMVENVEFRFRGISQQLCSSMFASGDYQALEGLLKQNVGPVLKYNYLPSNLPDYLAWQIRVQYRLGKTEEALVTANLILESNSAVHVDLTTLYRVLLLLDQEQVAEARTIFEEMESPDAVSAVMCMYIRGRLAMERGEYRAALQQVAQVVAFHSRDPEWMAPATELEARIYLAAGQPEKAAIVAGELILAYPGTSWSKLGEEIKKTSTGK